MKIHLTLKNLHLISNPIPPNNFFNFFWQIGAPVAAAIDQAMQDIERNTCIKFIRRTYQNDYIQFVSKLG